MQEAAAQSFRIAYREIDRFLSIHVVHYYLFSWSIALLGTISLSLLYLIYPSVLKSTRNTYLLLVCFVCLANLGYLSIQIFLIAGEGEINLPLHLCRSLVYLSTFAKPFGLYLICLFSAERLFNKILLKYFVALGRFRQLARTLFTLLIFFTVIFTVSIRLYQVIRLIPGASSNPTSNGVDGGDTDVSNSTTNDEVRFTKCFQSMNINLYSTFLSFYTVHYWYEHLVFIFITATLFIFLFFSCCSATVRSSSARFSTNTRFYLILTINFLIAEIFSILFHLVVDEKNNVSEAVQLVGLELLLHLSNLRCLLPPLVLGLILSIPLKEFFVELLFSKPYLSNIEEDDGRMTSMPVTRSRSLRSIQADDETQLQDDDFRNDL